MGRRTTPTPPAPRLKVFRARIGFHDWVIATTSQKKALAAWDVSRNLFAAGEASETNDPTAIALAMRTPEQAVALPVTKLAKSAPARKKGKR